MKPSRAHLNRIAVQWGLVAERIAADDELIEAIRTVLEFEEYRISVTPAMSDSEKSWALGERDGIASAFDILTNAERIRAIRGVIDEQISKEAEA